jgi:hypothetical protein
MHRVLALALLLACAGPPQGPPTPPLVVFTSRVDDDFRPVDRLERAPLSSDGIAIFVRWFDLGTDAERHYRCEIRDGSSQLVSLSEMTLHPTRSTWETQSRYEPNPAVDAPGTWRFRVFIDDELRVEAALEVSAE